MATDDNVLPDFGAFGLPVGDAATALPEATPTATPAAPQAMPDFSGAAKPIDIPADWGQPAELGGPTEPEKPARSRFHPTVDNAISSAAQEFGVDLPTMQAFAGIESGGRPSVVTGSYKGLYQLSDSEFAKHGGLGNIFDPAANARAAAAKIKAEQDAFARQYGRPPTTAELYMIHQQGVGGAAAHWANPEAPAWQNMASTGEGRQKGANWAKRAIWGNIPDDEKRRFGSVENITSRDFLDMWDRKVQRFGGGASGGAFPAMVTGATAAPSQASGGIPDGAVMQASAPGNIADMAPEEAIARMLSAEPGERAQLLENYLYDTLGVGRPPKKQPLPDFSDQAQAPDFSAMGTPVKPRGDGIIEGLTDPQQYKEVVKQFVPGVITTIGGVIQGLSAVNPIEASASSMQQYRAEIQRVPQMSDGDFAKFLRDVSKNATPAVATGVREAALAMRRGQLSPEEFERIFAKPTPLNERPFFKAGEAVTEFGRKLIPPAEGYEKSVGAQLGQGLGSMLAFLPAAYLNTPAAVSLFAASGMGEAAQNAEKFDKKEKAAGRAGLTEQQKITASLLGIGPGTTDILPLEVLLGRLPMPIPLPLQRPLAKAIGRIGGQAFIEGVQEGGQQFLQNLIEREVYNPEKSLGDEVPGNIGIGAGVGGIAQAGKEVGHALISRGRARGASQPAQPEPDGTPPAAPPGADGTPPAPTTGTTPAPASEPPAGPGPIGSGPIPTTPPASPDDAAILRGQGWSDADIAEMDPAERAEAVKDARTQGVTPKGAPAIAAAEAPSAEPIKDLVAQGRDLADPEHPRQALWLSGANLEALAGNQEGAAQLAKVIGDKGVGIDNFDGQGGLLIAKTEEIAKAVTEIRDRIERETTDPAKRAAAMQQLLGHLTGAGSGKAADATKVVQQVTKDGAVTRESAVTAAEAAKTAEEFKAAGRDVRTVTPQEAVARREGAVASEAFATDGAVPVGSRRAPSTIDTAADIQHAAAQVAEPTLAQAEAGNYRKGHVKLGGLNITIETPQGGTRRGTAPDGTPWEVKMPAHYGYVKRSKGADGEQMDVYLGPGMVAEGEYLTDNHQVYVIDQVDPDTGKFDEHKALLGFPSRAAALEAYTQAFSDGRGAERVGGVTEMPLSGFEEWLEGGARTRALARKGAEGGGSAAPATGTGTPPANLTDADIDLLVDSWDYVRHVDGKARPDVDEVAIATDLAKELAGYGITIDDFESEEAVRGYLDRARQEPARAGAPAEDRETAAPAKAARAGEGREAGAEPERAGQRRPAEDLDVEAPEPAAGAEGNRDERGREGVEAAGPDAGVEARTQELAEPKARYDGPALSNDDVELIVESWRYVREVWSRPKPQSLAAFIIAGGGLRDEGGDVRHIAGSARERPGLVNDKSGVELDRAALRAWDEGFFPFNTERPDINEFLDKLQEDLHTGSVFRAGNEEYLDDVRIADQMAEELTDYGFTPRQFRSEERLRWFLGQDRPKQRPGAAREAARDEEAAAERGAPGSEEVVPFDLPEAGEIAPKAERQPETRGADQLQDYRGQLIDGYLAPGEEGSGEKDGDRKRAFLADARGYLLKVAKILKERGFEPHPDKKGKPGRAVSVNPGGPAVSGDVSLSVVHPDGRGVYVSIGTALTGTEGGISLMARRASTKDRFGARSPNQWWATDLTAADLADRLEDLAAAPLPGEKPSKLGQNLSDLAGRDKGAAAAVDRVAGAEQAPAGERSIPGEPEWDAIPHNDWRDHLMRARVYAGALKIDFRGMGVEEIARAIDAKMAKRVGAPDGVTIEIMSSTVSDPEEARIKGGEFKVVATRKAPWSVEAGYGDNPEAAARDAVRKLKPAQSSMLPEATTKEKIAAEAKAKERRGGNDPMDVGMFGSDKDQTDLVDLAKQAPKDEAPAKVSPETDAAMEKGGNKAREHVLRLGKKHGREYGAMVLPDGRMKANRVPAGVRAESFLLVNRETAPELWTGAPRSVDFHHNHPRSSSFSRADYTEAAVRPALRRTIVHGHDGSRYSTEFIETDPMRLGLAFDVAMEATKSVTDKGVGLPRYRTHLIAEMMAEAGLIRYEADLTPADAADRVAALKKAMGPEWALAVEHIRNNEEGDDVLDQPAGPDGPAGDVAAAPAPSRQDGSEPARGEAGKGRGAEGDRAEGASAGEAGRVAAEGRPYELNETERAFVRSQFNVALRETKGNLEQVGGLIAIWEKQVDTPKAKAGLALFKEIYAEAIAKPEPTQEQKDDLATTENWWRRELTPAGRQVAAQDAGLKKNRHKVAWQHLSAEEHKALAQAYREKYATPDAVPSDASSESDVTRPGTWKQGNRDSDLYMKVDADGELIAGVMNMGNGKWAATDADGKVIGYARSQGHAQDMVDKPMPHGAGEGAFMTAKGSTYVIHADGTTSRNKKLRSDPGHEGDQGAKPRTEVTYYIAKKHVDLLAQPSNGSWRVWDRGDGTLAFLWRQDGSKPWGTSPSSAKIPVKSEPDVGLHPVELWKPETIKDRPAYRTLHVGNDIVALVPKGETTKAEKPTAAREEKPASKAETSVAAAEAADPLFALREKLVADGFKTIVEARAFAKKLGIDGTNKEIDEKIENAAVAAARSIIEKNGEQGIEPAFTFKILVGVYEKQPNLASRTSTSVANQAYSTPLPLAYVASRLAGVKAADVVFEPTAGNGALLIEAAPGKAFANELDPSRAAALREQGFRVTTNDATDPAQAKAIREQQDGADSVIMNPPFGAVRENGRSKSWTVDGLETSTVDHAIALTALQAMTDKGRAVLILGGIKATDTNERRKGYRGQAKREFFHKLYNTYNVTDHFTVSGDLYTKQGASWPVDVVVIEGRGKSERALPAAQPPAILSTWDEIGAKIPDANRADETARDAGRPARGAVEGSGEPARRNEGRGPEAVRGGSERLPAGREDDAAGVRGNSDRGQPGAAQSRAPSAPAGETRADRERGRADKPAAAGGVRPRVKGGQASYAPASQAGALDALIPVNMADAARAAMDRVEKRHGAVDSFIADRLGYDKADVGKYFAAEQIDAIAAAIDNVERGAAFIIGDQTGIGKGRQVAAMLRYAMRNNMVPVLVTEKPDLFGDMYRDLRDIGVPEMLGREPRMFITNTGETIPLDEEALNWKQEADAAREAGETVPPRRGKFLSGGGKAKQEKAMQALASGEATGTGDLPDVIFTTYDQMNTVKGQTTDRRRFLGAVAERALFAFDESHNAGGAAPTGWESKNKTPNRSEFVRDLATRARGVIFSSATYAKRPDVMDLYARTDMGRAVDDPKKLPELIQRGGVPMQQVVATMLADSGQYMRRERSFDGVEYAVEGVPVDAKAYEHFSDAIRAVFQFDMAVKEARQEIVKDMLDAQGAGQMRDSGVGDAGAHTTAFSSIMHNIVNQMLLAIKTNPTAERAIKAHRAGEKPVIGLASTMESFISDFAEAADIKIGDSIELDFGDVLSRYLERTLRITIKMPGEKKGVHHQIPVSKLPAGLRKQYEAAREQIRSGDYEGLPISPIDWLRFKMSEAGLKVAEVTGRQTMIDYSQSPPRYVNRPKTEQGPAGKRGSIAAFNRGALDALILNRSGATGVSMHASKDFRDQRRRRMILAQAEGNIDTHLQMLGRVHRTGQVIPPAYSQVAAEIPAEARPTAVLMRKMASLNANTTGARGSVFMADAVDFMNEIGDKVVAEVLAEDPDLDDALGGALKTDNEGRFVSEDAAKRATGRLTLLPPAKQSEFLDRITKAYKSELAQLDALGDNPLEAKTLDLQAKVLDVTPLKEKQGDGPFLDGSRIEKVSAKAQGRAMAPADVAAEVADHLKQPKPTAEPAQALSELAGKGRVAKDQILNDMARKMPEWIASDIAELSPDAKVSTKARHEAMYARWRETLNNAYPGTVVRLGMPSGDLDGVVLSVEKGSKTKNPVALSAWTVKIAVPDSARVLEFPMSKLFPPSVVKSEDEKGATIQWSTKRHAELMPAFDEARKDGRETRYIVTGNILGGYDQVSGRGRIVNFTTDTGEIRPGILMGREFALDKFMDSRAVRLTSGEQVAQFLDRVPTAEVKATDGNVTVRTMRGGFSIITPASRATGGRYYTEPGVRSALGSKEFEKRGNQMIASYVARDELVGALDAMRRAGAVFETKESQDIANEIVSVGNAGAMRSFVDDAPTEGEPRRNANGLELKLPYAEKWGDPRFDDEDKAKAVARLEQIARMPTRDAAWSDLVQAYRDINEIAAQLHYYSPDMGVEEIRNFGGMASIAAYNQARKGHDLHGLTESIFSTRTTGEMPEAARREIASIVRAGRMAIDHLLDARRAGLYELMVYDNEEEPRRRSREPKPIDTSGIADTTKGGFYYSAARELAATPDSHFPLGGWAVLNRMRQAGVKQAELDHFRLPELFGNKKPVTRAEMEQAIAKRVFEFRQKTSWLNPERSKKDYELGGTRAFRGPRIPGRGVYFERLMAFPKRLKGGEPFAPGYFKSPHWQGELPSTWASWRGSVRDVPEWGRMVVGEEGQTDYMQGKLGTGDEWTGRRPEMSAEEYLALKNERGRYNRVMERARDLMVRITATAYGSSWGDMARMSMRDMVPTHSGQTYDAAMWTRGLDALRRDANKAIDEKTYIGPQDTWGRQREYDRGTLTEFLTKLAQLRADNEKFFAPGSHKKYAELERSFTPTTPLDQSYVRTMLRDLLTLAAEQKADSISIATSETTNRIQINTHRSAAHFYDGQLKFTLTKELRRLTGDGSLELQETALPKAMGAPKREKPYTVWAARLSPKLLDKIRSEGLPMFSAAPEVAPAPVGKKAVTALDKAKVKLMLRQPVDLTTEASALAMHLAKAGPSPLPHGVSEVIVTGMKRVRGDLYEVTARDSDGKEYRYHDRADLITKTQGLFQTIDGRPVVALLPLDLTGNLVQMVGRVRAHESVHALRTLGYLPGSTRDRLSPWGRLVGHANTLGVLEMPRAEMYARMGDPRAATASKTVSTLEVYHKLYAGSRELSEMLAQEAAAHFVEMYHAGAFSDEEVAPVRDLLDEIVTGQVSGGGDPLLALDTLRSADIEAGRSMRRDLDSLGYYSHALEAARALKQAKGTPEQMLAMLKAAGVKDAEITATNLADLFGQPSVMRDDIVKHLEGNGLGLNEVAYGKPGRFDRDGYAEKTFGRPYIRLTRDERAAVDAAAPGNEKWSNYSLDPSNPTYRETVLHLPAKMPDFAQFKAESLANGVPEREVERNYQRLIADPGRIAREDSSNFQSGHFSEPNIVGHIMTSLVKHEGKPVYLIDQIQSDWGQKIRDGGVRDEAKIALLKKQQAEAESLTRAAAQRPENAGQLWTELPEGREWGRINAELIQAERNHTPGHPLVNTTDQWTTTTLRRAIRQAAEAGADYVAIPSGKTVLSYNPGDEHGMATFYDKIVPKNLRNILGKLDKASPDPQRVATLDTPSKGAAGEGFTLFPLTEKVKRAVMESGQPLFQSTTTPKLDQAAQRDLIRSIDDALAIVRRIGGPEVRVQFAETISADEVPGAMRTGGPDTLGGYYQPGRLDAKAVIALATNDPLYDLRTTAGHEAWHHVETALADPREMQLLTSPGEMRRMQGLAAAEMSRPVDDPAVQSLAPVEVRAIAFQRYRRLRDEGADVGGIHIAARRLFERIRQVLAAVRNALAGRGYTSFEDVFERARTGEIARERAGAPAEDAPRGPWAWAQNARGNVPAVSLPPAANDTQGRQEPVRSSFLTAEVKTFAAAMLEPVDGGSVTSTELYEAYAGLAASANQEPMGFPEFTNAMNELGYQRAKIAGRIRYIGIAIKGVEPPTPPPRSRYDSEASAQSARERMRQTVVPGGRMAPGQVASLEFSRHISRPTADEAAQGYTSAYVVEFQDLYGQTVRLRELAAREGEGTRNSLREERTGQYLLRDAPDFALAGDLRRHAEQIAAERTGLSRPAERLAQSVPTGPAQPPGGVSGVLTRRIRRTLDRISPTVDAARVRLQDRVLPVRRLQEQIERTTGTKIPINLDIYTAEAIYHGRAGERLTDLQDRHIEPLIERLRAAEIDVETFGDYLYARHAAERNAQIAQIDPTNTEGSGMSNAEANRILGEVAASGKQAAYDAAAKMVDDMQAATLDTLLRSGLIDRETYDNWKSQYQNYVPLRGFEADEENPERARTGRGFDIRGPEARQALGRRSKADNPLLYAVLQAQQAIVRSEKNRVDKTLYRAVQAYPDDAVWKVFKGEHRRRRNPDTGLLETYWVPPAFVRADNIHGVKIGGKQYYVELRHPGLARAMRGTGNEMMGGMLGRAMMTVARTYSSLVTSYNPEFVISNFMRDVQQAVLNSSDIAEKPEGVRKQILSDALSFKSIRGIVNALRGDGTNEYARWFEEFREAGGKVSFMNVNDIDRIRKDINASFGAGRIRRGLRAAKELVEDYNSAVENGVRLSTYIAMRKAGIAQDRAAFVARELTVNFNRKGEVGPALNAMYLFFNASAQGTVRLAQAITRSKAVRYAIGGIFAFGMMLDLLNAFMAGDDDDGENAYDKVKTWIKERNLVIMIPGGKPGDYIQIPLPHGYNLPYLAGQQMMSVMRGATKPLTAAGTLAANMVDSFNPLGSSKSFAQLVAPTMLDPVVQVIENKTWYGGPIYPTKFDKRQPDSESYFSSAPWWWIGTAKVLNSATGGNAGRPGWVDVSPEVLQHYAEFAMGGVGKFVSNAVKTGQRLVTGEEWIPEDTPFLRRVYGNQTSVSRRRDFFDAWDVVDQAHYEMTKLMKAGDRAGAAEVREKYGPELAAYGALSGTQKALSAYRKQRDQIALDRTLTDAQKREKTDDIQKRENGIILQGLGVYNRAKKEKARPQEISYDRP